MADRGVPLWWAGTNCSLFGAYQFMLDPADRARPTLPSRIGLALLLVIGAGLLGTRFAKRTA